MSFLVSIRYAHLSKKFYFTRAITCACTCVCVCVRNAHISQKEKSISQNLKKSSLLYVRACVYVCACASVEMLITCEKLQGKSLGGGIHSYQELEKFFWQKNLDRKYSEQGGGGAMGQQGYGYGVREGVPLRGEYSQKQTFLRGE